MFIHIHKPWLVKHGAVEMIMGNTAINKFTSAVIIVTRKRAFLLYDAIRSH